MSKKNFRIPSNQVRPDYWIQMHELVVEKQRVDEENASLRRQLDQAAERARTDYILIKQLREQLESK